MKRKQWRTRIKVFFDTTKELFEKFQTLGGGISKGILMVYFLFRTVLKDRGKRKNKCFMYIANTK